MKISFYLSNAMIHASNINLYFAYSGFPFFSGIYKCNLDCLNSLHAVV
ncbi:hypothetical protein W822_07035 [Advenella kashmirensis W13003]|uniref:Uncharacterized protein n=1 Tax=Advenella kashmirensis W13003 TaxID=1424334 RepID=V8QUX5_9BURK|nr:hypothetical protein W822_07035 [Advenella kashmirensis W13003]